MVSRNAFRAASFALVAVLASGAAGVAEGRDPSSASPSDSPVDSRIVAVGDIHGAYEGFVAILRETGLLDQHGRWAGGDAVLVQTGDFTDRGPGVRRVMDLLRRLQDEASAAGGRVEVLLGNHEMMNLVADYRDVTPEIVAAFADERSEQRRREAAKQYDRLRKRLSWSWNPEEAEFPSMSRDEVLEALPPGTLEYRRELAPDGSYGSWLRELPAVAVVGDVLFAHAGPGPEFAGWPVERIVDEVRGDIERMDDLRRALLDNGWMLPWFDLQQIVDTALMARAYPVAAHGAPAPDVDGAGERIESLLELPSWSSFRPDGLLWFRGYAHWEEERLAGLVDEVLDTHGAGHIAVGHTPQPDGVGVRLDGRVLLIDTGMLAPVYGGRPAALEIRGDDIDIVYAAPADEEATVEDPTAASVRPGEPATIRWRGPDGEPLPFTSFAEAEEFLRGAEIVEIEDVGAGVTRPRRLLLERDGVVTRAIYHDVDIEREAVRLSGGRFRMHFRDWYGYQGAAYEVAKLLGLDVVPPTVLRRVRGEPGSVQLWIEDVITEAGRAAERLHPRPALDFVHQMQRMYIFDYLVANDDRNAGNILLDPETWRVWLVDHTRTFQRFAPLDDQLARIGTCPQDLYETLRSWQEEDVRQKIRQRLDPFLEGRDIDALLERAGHIVEHVDRLVDAHGEGAVLCALEHAPH